MDKTNKRLNEMMDSLFKREAPIVARTRRKILKQAGLSALKRKALKQKDNQVNETYKSESTTNFEQPLAKNEYEVTQFNNGEFKMEFGPEVPELVKKRAMEWAKKRGLKTKEMSLGKSNETNSWVIFK